MEWFQIFQNAFWYKIYLSKINLFKSCNLSNVYKDM